MHWLALAIALEMIDALGSGVSVYFVQRNTAKKLLYTPRPLSDCRLPWCHLVGDTFGTLVRLLLEWTCSPGRMRARSENLRPLLGIRFLPFPQVRARDADHPVRVSPRKNTMQKVTCVCGVVTFLPRTDHDDPEGHADHTIRTLRFTLRCIQSFDHRGPRTKLALLNARAILFCLVSTQPTTAAHSRLLTFSRIRAIACLRNSYFTRQNAPDITLMLWAIVAPDELPDPSHTDANP